jgi:transposase
MCLDKAYDSEVIRALLEEFGFTAHIRSRGEEAESLQKHARKKARRWVVERSHSWLNRFRALLIRWAKRPDAYAAQLHLAFAIITWRGAGLLG